MPGTPSRLGSGLAEPAITLAPPRSVAWSALQVLDRFAQWSGRAPARIAAHACGERGEDLACWSLRQRGYMIVARRFRLAGREGELDLIAFEGVPRSLVFVEVKTRTQEGLFAAEDAVDQDKRRHLIRLARAYRRRSAYRGPYRYDVVTVYGPFEAKPRLTLYRNAFFEEH